MTDLGPNKSANEGPESENFERYDSFLVARAPGLYGTNLEIMYFLKKNVPFFLSPGF